MAVTHDSEQVAFREYLDARLEHMATKADVAKAMDALTVRLVIVAGVTVAAIKLIPGL